MNAILERELVGAESGTVALLNRSEVDAQIATAHRFPRSIKSFLNEARELATLNEQIASECTYAVPRDGKVIEGPSARFAEIVQSAWGNIRSGSRIVDIGPAFITAQGVCHDLQRNVAVTFEVQRRITGKNARRYSDDMIVVTGNAASSIALRNAILKVIPKAFWSDVWEEARRVVRGDFKTLANRRAAALETLQGYGVKPDQVFSLLSVRGLEDITLDHLVTLRGIVTAMKDGDTTAEEAFRVAAAAPPPPPPAGAQAAKAPPPPPKPSNPAVPPRPPAAAAGAPVEEAPPAASSTGDDFPGDLPAGLLGELEARFVLAKSEKVLGDMWAFAEEDISAAPADVRQGASDLYDRHLARIARGGQ